MARRIGLLTAGGDAPGLNVCLKALVNGLDEAGYESVGIRKGWEGMLRLSPESPATHSDNAMILTRSRVRDIDRNSGSFLHSSRINPAAVDAISAHSLRQPMPDGANTIDLSEHIHRVYSTLRLEALVVLGDNAALNYAARLSSEGIPIVGIPKSVHNDVNGSDYCLGFSTALARGVKMIHEVRAMAGSREEIAVVEVFGRNSGLSTMLISVLAGADRLLVPEVPFDPELLAMLLADDKRTNPNNYAILAMSEAVTIDPAKGERYAAFAPRLFRDSQSAPAGALAISPSRTTGVGAGGSGAVVTEMLESLLGQRLLFQPLSYLLRVGEPDGQDLLGAMNFAALAVGLLRAGRAGRLVSYKRGENYVDQPLEVVTKPGGTLDVAKFYSPQLCQALPGVFWAARI
jgi:ATP-dependent phosphofructokinase / diphosphate-dependent phosphofructokinase